VSRYPRLNSSTVSLNICVIGQWFGDMKSAAKATVLTLEETSLVCINASAIAAAKTSLLLSAQPARNHSNSAQHFKELLIGTESIGSGTFGEVSFIARGFGVCPKPEVLDRCSFAQLRQGLRVQSNVSAKL
jgi:hypothetical protein